ncbi:MAG: NHL repeat-containing protein [Bacteroidetes bacterium]|nr:NHL repeat-containing protein [Bacteroidota bacterium]
MGTISSLILFLVLLPQRDTTVYPFLQLVEQVSVGNFERASRIVVDFRKRIFVIDQKLHTVFYYQSANESPLSVGGYGWNETSFDTPTDVTTDGINIVVTDYGNHRVQFFDYKLRYIGSWKGHFSQDGSIRKFGFPRGIAISTSGELYILDGENIRVVQYSRRGEHERAFGDASMKEGRLINPLRISLYRDKVFILEPDRIFQYDRYGTYIRTIGKKSFSNALGFCFLGNTIFVLTPTVLYCYAIEGALLSITPLQYIFTNRPLTDVQDIATDGRSLYLLTTRNFRILEIHGK